MRRSPLREHRPLFMAVLFAAMVGLVTVPWAIWSTLDDAYRGCFHRWSGDLLCLPNAIFNVGLPACLLTVGILGYLAKKERWPYDDETVDRVHDPD